MAAAAAAAAGAGAAAAAAREARGHSQFVVATTWSPERGEWAGKDVGTRMVFAWSRGASIKTRRTVVSTGDRLSVMMVPNVTLSLTHEEVANQWDKHAAKTTKRKPKTETVSVPVSMLRLYFCDNDTAQPINFDYDVADDALGLGTPLHPISGSSEFPICEVQNPEFCPMRLSLFTA